MTAPVPNPEYGAERVLGPTLGRTEVVDVTAVAVVISARAKGWLGRFITVQPRDGLVGVALRVQPPNRSANVTTAPLLSARSPSAQQCGSVPQGVERPYFIPDPGLGDNGGASGDVEICLVTGGATVVVEVRDAQV